MMQVLSVRRPLPHAAPNIVRGCLCIAGAARLKPHDVITVTGGTPSARCRRA